jgi:hypothetical protein
VEALEIIKKSRLIELNGYLVYDDICLECIEIRFGNLDVEISKWKMCMCMEF